MIHFVEGDILLSHAQVIAHGIAPHDHFDKGLALELRQRWPSLVRDYRHWAHDNSPESGTLWAWSGVDADGSVRGIVNLLTQEDLHRGPAGKPGKASLENVSRCLKELAHHVQSEGIHSLALPRLATGVGGLEWAEVRPLVEKHLGDLDIPVVVYEVFRQGVEAEEPLG
ncbi:macro domain-containing protein [Stutzerimonas kirkiae]|uniref:Appr-1-p processing protein n=1 Tax=Stutzerimonas kirkiae TaxID=2211392 RepID=A0A4Q9RE63_9GAMM|nr:macro domain-containing protein [Stutzerimonas kirkiae]TBU98637.1 Appr-1-p processing protein [Stutzerimonas kirkiae]TBV00267.1 Appr-1-p processing protein [Stutzerimonas kirkiae]TBV06098.1 Appr-1-p processing protein [Stutzerimonas kirkiae]TBV14254.1 Appr-1-p processing protein [Stutzerimonas kirkiae]